MTAAEILKEARRLAGHTQRSLAEKAGIPQSTVARIERGTIDPRVGTLAKLLDACHHELEARVVRDFGIDRSLIREHLKLTPTERLEWNESAIELVEELRKA